MIGRQVSTAMPDSIGRSQNNSTREMSTRPRPRKINFARYSFQKGSDFFLFEKTDFKEFLKIILTPTLHPMETGHPSAQIWDPFSTPAFDVRSLYHTKFQLNNLNFKHLQILLRNNLVY